jgi:hypothetical protein
VFGFTQEATQEATLFANPAVTARQAALATAALCVLGGRSAERIAAHELLADPAAASDFGLGSAAASAAAQLDPATVFFTRIAPLLRLVAASGKALWSAPAGEAGSAQSMLADAKLSASAAHSDCLRMMVRCGEILSQFDGSGLGKTSGEAGSIASIPFLLLNLFLVGQ